MLVRPEDRDPWYSPALEAALGSLDTLAEAGLVALPSKPTDAMLIAGARAAGCSVETVYTLWNAMVAAAE
ncbi:hypothetical protein [Radicibacter daui]|uniref:hypothetical protein n=1 Tax=Radicibacter daui TaxID=3064829 RepID=UPI0040468F3A